MTYLLYALAWLAVFIGPLIAMVYCLSIFGKQAIEDRLMALPDVSDADKAAAWLCFERAGQFDTVWRTIRYRLAAPFVLLMPLWRLPREANELPERYRAWTNDVSINGDSGGTLLTDGTWLQWHDTPEARWPALVDCLQVKYDDPRYEGDAYYARGHHPRSFWARYVWLAFRNVRSQEYVDHGVTVNEKPEIVSGAGAVSSGTEGYVLYRSGDVYSWHSSRKWGPLCLWSQVGFKLGIAYNEWKGEPKRVAVVALWASPKGWRG